MFHIWNLTSRYIPCYSHRATSVHNFAAAVAILKRVEMIANFSIISIRINRFVLVEARDRSR